MGQPVKALSMTKAFKIIYYIVISFIGIIAILLVVSVFPITGNYKVMIVQSGSMAPEIKMGSVVVVKPTHSVNSGQADYKIGDVITFQAGRNNEPITHRIYDIRVVDGEPRYITKGDVNNAPDQREVSKNEIMGKVFFDIPYLGYVVNFAQKPLGFSLIIIIPAVLIIGDEIKKIYVELKKKKARS